MIKKAEVKDLLPIMFDGSEDFDETFKISEKFKEEGNRFNCKMLKDYIMHVRVTYDGRESKKMNDNIAEFIDSFKRIKKYYRNQFRCVPALIDIYSLQKLMIIEDIDTMNSRQIKKTPYYSKAIKIEDSYEMWHYTNDNKLPDLPIQYIISLKLPVDYYVTFKGGDKLSYREMVTILKDYKIREEKDIATSILLHLNKYDLLNKVTISNEDYYEVKSDVNYSNVIKSYIKTLR